jgi:hypothetical protein
MGLCGRDSYCGHYYGSKEDKKHPKITPKIDKKSE